MNLRYLRAVAADAPLLPVPTVREGIDSPSASAAIFDLWCQRRNFMPSILRVLNAGKTSEKMKRATIIFSLLTAFLVCLWAFSHSRPFVEVFLFALAYGIAVMLIGTCFHYIFLKDYGALAHMLLCRDRSSLLAILKDIKPRLVVSGLYDETLEVFLRRPACSYLDSVSRVFEALAAEALLYDQMFSEGAVPENEKIWKKLIGVYQDLNRALLPFDMALRPIETYIESASTTINAGKERVLEPMAVP